MDNLEFIDVSYAKKITDVGLVHFASRTLPLTTLIVNGCNGITHAGLNAILNSCSKTLLDLEAAFLDQENLKGEFLTKVGFCWQLELLDLAGSTSIEDNAYSFLAKGEVTLAEGQQP